MSNDQGNQGHLQDYSCGSDSFSSNESKIQRVKMVLLGATDSGKSSIAIRYTRGKFIDGLGPTIGAEFSITQTINVSNKTIKFEIWDTAGMARYWSLAPMYYRGALAAIVIFDITLMNTFRWAISIVRELRQKASSLIIIILAGNKADLASEKRAVPREDAQALAEEYNLVYTEVSAKTGMGVSDMFMTIAKTVARHSPAEQAESTDTLKVGNEKKKKKRALCYQ